MVNVVPTSETNNQDIKQLQNIDMSTNNKNETLQSKNNIEQTKNKQTAHNDFDQTHTHE